MIILFAALMLMIILGLRYHKDGINPSYISKNNTQPIKGIFVVIVFLSHVRTYAAYEHFTDIFVINCLNYLGQLMVALFLFYSGYGICEAIKAKGKKYVDSIPLKRVGSTFIDFAFAVCLFIALNYCFGKTYSLNHILLSFTGWVSVGNSNWYMFAIFALYLLTYVSFKLCKTDMLKSIIVFSVLSLIYVYVLSRVQPSRFSNTALCYTAGMWFSYFKAHIDGLFQSKRFIYYIIAFAIIAFYFVAYPYKGVRIMYFNGVSILFSLSIVFVSMKFSLQNKVLTWFGDHLFWVYILQRLPMIVLKNTGFAQSSPYMFLFVTFLITVIASYYVNIFMTNIKKKIYGY